MKVIVVASYIYRSVLIDLLNVTRYNIQSASVRINYNKNIYTSSDTMHAQCMHMHLVFSNKHCLPLIILLSVAIYTCTRTLYISWATIIKVLSRDYI